MTSDQIKAMARAVMPPEMAAAETELREIETAQADLCSKIAADQGIASGTHQSWRKLNSLEDRRAAQARLDCLNAEAAMLDRAAAEVRGRIKACTASNAEAVRAALVPVRKAAAEQAVSSIAQLTAAIAAINATGICLKEAGVDAVRLPEPLLSGMSTIAKSIISAASPEMEKR
ncbi:hypothetical protein [Bradyrhizobium sp. 6(2017)]|uniref:hypothetical protein n=1 Tax=Bradyrhizobium sp. 6(2017) TaxID=1197460 RepID=UPI0013E1E1A9|nr:hypothetical protein [Bradyrhizobium sp. 6(2017)]QIG92155.1 hypothetical protein G6P99_06325 [Bradyrhizobium sp. 6(2017)]